MDTLLRHCNSLRLHKQVPPDSPAFVTLNACELIIKTVYLDFKYMLFPHSCGLCYHQGPCYNLQSKAAKYIIYIYIYICRLVCVCVMFSKSVHLCSTLLSNNKIRRGSFWDKELGAINASTLKFYRKQETRQALTSQTPKIIPLFLKKKIFFSLCTNHWRNILKIPQAIKHPWKASGRREFSSVVNKQS